MKTFGLVVLLLLLPACYTSPYIQPLHPLPQQYLRWWQEVQECSHTHGQFDRLVWYIVRGRSFRCLPIRQQCVGLWFDFTDDAHIIWLAESEVLSPDVVKHEMLHELLHGDTEHVSPYFEACTQA